MEAHTYVLSVFAEPPYQGTEARILTVAQPLASAVMQRIAQVSRASATCFAVTRPDEGHDVYCYSAYGMIRCCGHGLLATAYVLHCRRYGERDTGAQPLQLYQPGARQPLQATWDQDAVWLRFPRLQCQPVGTPTWAAKAFGVKPCRAAYAGGDEGYLVLEFATGVSLADLRVDYSLIAQNTRRAVIVSQRSRCKSYDFLLRYFAPQYGVDEDNVTGSACRVLADYWTRQTGESQFVALQCSATGGVVKVRIDHEHVWISGRVKTL